MTETNHPENHTDASKLPPEIHAYLDDALGEIRLGVERLERRAGSLETEGEILANIHNATIEGGVLALLLRDGRVLTYPLPGRL